MKCSVAAIFGAALVLGSSKQPSQSDNRNVASRDNPVPGAFQPNRIGTNKDAGRGVLGLSFESSISGSDSINGSNDNNKSTGEERAEEEASKDDNNSSFDKEKVAEAFADDSNNGNNLLHDFGHQNLSVQGGEDTDKSISARGEYQFKLLDMTERLTEISQNRLRGYNQRASDRESGVLETIGEIKDLIRSKVDQLKTFRTLIEAVGIKQLKDLLFSFISDAVSAGKAIAGFTGSDKELNDVGADLALADEGNGHEMVEYLAGMDRGELASTVVSNELIGHMELLADTLSDVEETLSPPQRRTRGPSKSKSNVKQPPNLGSAAGNPRTPRVSRHLREKQSYRPLPHLKHVDRLWAAAGEEGRRHLEEMTVAPQCFACEEDEIQCNCRRLKECSLELTWYDMAVRLVGGFIEIDPDSDTYGQLLTEDMNDIDVFEARNKLNQKMAEIKRLADPLLPVNEDNCNALLSELVTACGEGSCSNPNQYSFQLSVNDVCQAVDTPIKFGIMPMGEFYDFRYFAVRKHPYYRYFSEKVAFVTSGRFNGNLGGLAGADATCQTVAQNAGLGGRFRAWLSDRTTDAASRFNRDHDDVPVVLVDGRRIANNWNDMTTRSRIQQNLNVMETGSPVTQTNYANIVVWTGTSASGRYVGPTNDGTHRDCESWNSASSGVGGMQGNHAVRNRLWTDFEARNCDGDKRLYCFSQHPEPAQAESPLNVKHAVRCCRDDDAEEDIWYRSPAASCRVNALAETWTGELPPGAQLDAPPGYTGYPGRTCRKEDNDDDGYFVLTPQECGNLCDRDADCDSFDLTEGNILVAAQPVSTCYLHTSCHHYGETDTANTATNWYFKHHDIIPAGYERFPANFGCPTTRFSNILTVQECANLCSADPGCKSFAYSCTGTRATNGCNNEDFEPNRCWLSSTCDDLEDTNEQPANSFTFNWFPKKEGFQDDETECLFLTHGDAEEHCEDSGGRLCTKEELEDGCASFMGCGFDSSLVWSSTETSPEVCETDPSQQATSYASCGNFVSAMEQLYAGRPDTFAEEENPLRLNAASQASSDFENVQFPTRFNWIIDQTNGIASLYPNSPYLYDLEESLSTSEADLFCDAGLGPPTVLAQACDTSMDFLLGSSVSIGMLTSTAKAVNEFSPFPKTDDTRLPRWHEWYTDLKHNPVVDFVDEWTEFYLNITDDREMPAWFDVYLKIMDGSVRRLEPRREGRIYCRDDVVNYGDTKNSIEKCNRAWLNQTSNPYDDYMDIYKSTPPPLPTGLIAEEVAGSAGSVSVSSKGLEMTGSGTLGGQWDTFFFAYGQHSGDFVVEVRLQVSSADLDDLYAGLMIRESSSPGSIYYAAGVDNGNQFQTSYRKEPSGTADVFTGQSAGASGVWLKITKANNMFSAQSSTDRINWNSIGSSSALEFSNGALRAGVFVTGGATVIASDLSVTKLYGVATEYDVCEHDVCLEDWLEFDGIPYEEDHGCYEFYWSCVLNRPEMYQCQQFWDFCRDELIELEPKWDETITVDDKGVVSKQFCNNNKHLTCDLDYLENGFDFEQESFACQDFATYCRNELNLTHPKYVYPPKYCRMPDEPDELGTRELTCQLDWIDDETRLDDVECNDFKEYCQTQLVITYPRYVWPLPRSPVIDDFMPGYCCLDTPTGTDFESEFWGQHYDSSQDGMKCQNRGKWHMGMSDEACSNGGGQWFRTPCITLHRCIDARPRKDEDGYSESFEEFVVENEIEIYDHTDLEQCQTARAALGFDVDHPNDHEVCEEFNNRLCDLFFRDLDFLAGGADGEEVKFEQVTYTPIEYPPDDPLTFEKLPGLASLDIKEELEEEVEKHRYALEKASFTLGILVGEFKEVVDKTIDIKNDLCKAKKGACNVKKQAVDLLVSKISLASVYNEAVRFIPSPIGTFQNPLYGVKSFAIAALEKKRLAAEVALLGCYTAGEVTCVTLGSVAKAYVWALFFAAKLAKKAVDIAREDVKLPETMTKEGFEYNEATYHNVIRQYEWNAEALDIVNLNIREQHIQMRGELQARHQDITNDVNQFTTCMSNFLGIQIFNALPGASAGSLSTLCSNLLGVGSGRRRLGSNEGPYSLKVTYDDSSFIEDIKEIQGAEEEIVDELHNVEEIELDILQKQEQILVEMKEIREAMDIPPRPSLPTRPPTRPPTVVVTTPRPSSYRAAAICGNDSCETDETDKSCPKDCTNVQLDTTSYDQSMASSSESIRFAIKAKRAVAIKSLSFHTSTSARNSEITVKTQEGQYGRGIFSGWTTDGWTTVFHGRVFARGYASRGAQLTTVKFDKYVVVPAGKAQSFEVHIASSRIMVQLGGQEGMLAGQDMALEVYVGRSGAQSPAAFGGIIEYDGLDDGSTTGGRSNTGGRSKSAKAKTAKLEKDEMLVTGTNTAFLQAESNGEEEEVVALDLVRVDGRALGDKVGAIMNDKMGALEENVKSIKADVEATNESIKADVKATNDKILALETKLGSLETKLGSMEGMMAQIVKLLEAPGDGTAEEEIGDGSTN